MRSLVLALAALSARCASTPDTSTNSGGSGDHQAGGSNVTGGTAAANTGGGVENTGGMSGVEVVVLVDSDFQDRKPGPYTKDLIASDFGTSAPWNNGIDAGRATIVDEAGNTFFRVTYPAKQFGPEAGGVQFEIPLQKSYPELYLSYKVRFALGFDFVKGGKLPGLVGGSSPTGCKPAKDGFSARNMWRPGGRVVQYVYHPTQPDDCGDNLGYKIDGADVSFKTGEWHTVRHRVVMNDYGKNNGILQAWYDGTLTLDDRAREWRIADFEYDGIDAFYFSTFFGGGDASWAPSAAQTADFDDIVVSTGPE